VPWRYGCGGVNFGELDATECRRNDDRETTIEKIREEFARIPGVAANIGGFISHRMDEVIGQECARRQNFRFREQLRTIGQQVNDVTKTVEGIVDLQLELKCQSNRSKSSSTELLLLDMVFR